jgi:hypothetical protein
VNGGRRGLIGVRKGTNQGLGVWAAGAIVTEKSLRSISLRDMKMSLYRMRMQHTWSSGTCWINEFLLHDG